MNYNTMELGALIEAYVNLKSKIELKEFSIECAEGDENLALKAISFYNRCLDCIKAELENRFGYTVD